MALLLSFCTSHQSDECVSGDCINGQGTYVWPEGDKYVGAFIDGMREGQGIYYFTDSTYESGLWANDTLVE